MKVSFKDIPYDRIDPIQAYYALQGQGGCILESSPGEDRYSFIGADPIASISGTGDYRAALREFQRRHRWEADHPLALYAGGAVGYITYDQEYFFQLYRSTVAFDHQTKRAVVSTLGNGEDLDILYAKLAAPFSPPSLELKMGPIEADRSDEEYREMMKRAKEHLLSGDVYQIVLSRTFKASLQGDPFLFYQALRKTSPAPFLFFFDLGAMAVAGASPEKLISVQDGVVESMPIAGTCPKGASIDDLLNDPKEIAEHVMLVDLARSDVGAVSEPGTVRVAEFKSVHSFSHVSHIVSRVVGKLDPRFDPLDAFSHSFPAGTLTGAPKQRAMELIETIEGSKRGLYGGAIVAFDAKGNLTSCIAIRMGVIRNQEMEVRSGAGIVLDSDPDSEVRETRYKANTVLEAFLAFDHR